MERHPRIKFTHFSLCGDFNARLLFLENKLGSRNCRFWGGCTEKTMQVVILQMMWSCGFFSKEWCRFIKRDTCNLSCKTACKIICEIEKFSSLIENSIVIRLQMRRWFSRLSYKSAGRDTYLCGSQSCISKEKSWSCRSSSFINLYFRSKANLEKMDGKLQVEKPESLSLEEFH